MMAKKDTIAVVIPRAMRELIQEHIKMDMHLNLSDFVREAIREKIQRETPELYREFLKRKEVRQQDG